MTLNIMSKIHKISIFHSCSKMIVIKIIIMIKGVGLCGAVFMITR